MGKSVLDCLLTFLPEKNKCYRKRSRSRRLDSKYGNYTGHFEYRGKAFNEVIIYRFYSMEDAEMSSKRLLTTYLRNKFVVQRGEDSSSGVMQTYRRCLLLMPL